MSSIKLAKLKLKNFKSFKQATIPIGSGFTAIAGANGTGKSNILDALLFVFGATSLKMLRASKLTDLVNRYANENYAEVELTIKDNERNINYVISRVIDKQGKSIFRMNGKRCSLNEIVSLLNELNIRYNGYNIVVQGDINKIIEMNPVQRRELIDELAGLKEFDEKKAEALKNLEKVENKIKEVKIVLNEREIRLKELEAEKEVAERYQQLKEELYNCKFSLLNNEIKKLENELKKISEKENKVLEKKKKFEERGEEIKREVSELEEKIEAINMELIKSGQSIYEGIGKFIEEKRLQKRILEERIKNNEDRLRIVAENIVKLEEKLSNIGEQKENEGRAELKERIKELEKVEKDLREELEEKNSVAKKFSQKISELKNKLDEKFLELKEKQNEYYKAKNEFERLKESRDENIKAAQLKETELLELKRDVERKRELVKKIKEIKEKYGKIDVALKRNKEKLMEFYQAKNKKDERISVLKEAIDALKKSKASCLVCGAELKEKRKALLLKQKDVEINLLLNDINSLKEKISSKEKEISNLEVLKEKLIKWESEIKGLTELENKINILEEEIRYLQNSYFELDEAENKVNKLLRELQKVEAEKQAIALELKKNSLSKILEERQKIEEELKNILSKKNNCLIELTKIEMFEKELLHNKEEWEKRLEELKSEKEELKKKNIVEAENLKELESELEKLQIELKKAKRDEENLHIKKGKLQKKAEALKEKLNKINSELQQITFQLNQFNIEKSKINVRISDLKEEISEFENAKHIELSEEKLKKKIEKINSELDKIGEVNLKALKGFEEYKKEMEEIYEKIKRLEEEKIAVEELIEKIEIKRTETFMECFERINNYFMDVYKELSNGEAKLVLTIPEKPFESGLIIEAKHLGEKTKTIEEMSGGEKALTALAFLFALQKYEPAPFYIFDEADAALDKANSEKLAKMIKEISDKSQFIAITHNDSIVKNADQIIGVTLNKQKKSSVIGLKLKEEIAKVG